MQPFEFFCSQYKSLLHILRGEGGACQKLSKIPFALNDASVPIPSDGHDGHGGHKKWKNFAGRDATAKPNRVGAEGPLFEQQLPQGNRHREETEEEVREGQGHDEVVVCRAHRRLPQNCNL
jgi:hypothetical protein